MDALDRLLIADTGNGRIRAVPQLTIVTKDDANNRQRA